MRPSRRCTPVFDGTQQHGVVTCVSFIWVAQAPSLPWASCRAYIQVTACHGMPHSDLCCCCRRTAAKHPQIVHGLCAHALSSCPGIIVRYNLQRRILMDGRVVAKCYLWEGSMVADVVSTLPSILQARCMHQDLLAAPRRACRVHREQPDDGKAPACRRSA
jgi:hypothetical protein